MDPKELLQRLMDEHGLNPNSLAKATHHKTKQPQIHRFLKGTALEPKRSTWSPVAQLFKIPVEAFFDPRAADTAWAAHLSARKEIKHSDQPAEQPHAFGMAQDLSDAPSTLASTTRGDAMRQVPPADGYVRLPMMGEAAAGDGREAIELVEHVDVADDWVRRTLRTNPATLRVLTARGHSMTGQIEDGDVMFVAPAAHFDDDGIYIIEVGGLLRVKRLRLRVLDQLLSIESNDGRAAETIPLSQVDGNLRICGRVLGAWSLRKM